MNSPNFQTMIMAMQEPEGEDYYKRMLSGDLTIEEEEFLWEGADEGAEVIEEVKVGEN